MSAIVRRVLSVAVMALCLMLAIGSFGTIASASAAPRSSGSVIETVGVGAGIEAPRSDYRFPCFVMTAGCVVLNRAETAEVADSSPAVIVGIIAFACSKAPGPTSVACGIAGGAVAITAKSNANEARRTGRCLAVGLLNNMPGTMIAPCS